MYRADLHIHSRYANATSPSLTLGNLAVWSKKKGVDLMGTGDFSYPIWLEDLKKGLSYDSGTGFYLHESGMHFMLTNEVSLVYTDNGKVKKIHLLVFAPDFKTVDALNKEYAKYGNLEVDGRPVLAISSRDFVKITREVSPLCEIVPAHIWTPWFGIMGKRFGYDSLEECFKDQYEYIHAIETGLSSDPLMNWYIFDKKISIVSFSDAHSLEKLGRELTMFSGEMTYAHTLDALAQNEIEGTIEFFPEEGKYHYSGHRKCKFCALPQEDLDLKGICPVCHRKMTQGVVRRVVDVVIKHAMFENIDYIDKHISRSEDGFLYFNDRAPFVRLVPLQEIVAKSLGIKGVKTKKVVALYDSLINEFGAEVDILLRPPQKLKEKYPQVYQNIIRVLKGDIILVPGFDNTYGDIVFN